MGRAKEEVQRSAKAKHTSGAFEKGKVPGGKTEKSGRDRIVKSPITTATKPGWDGPAQIIRTKD